MSECRRWSSTLLVTRTLPLLLCRRRAEEVAARAVELAKERDAAALYNSPEVKHLRRQELRLESEAKAAFALEWYKLASNVGLSLDGVMLLAGWGHWPSCAPCFPFTACKRALRWLNTAFTGGNWLRSPFKSECYPRTVDA